MRRRNILTPSRGALATAPLEYLCRRQLYSPSTDMKLIVLRAGFCEASFSRAKALAKASIIGVNIFVAESILNRIGVAISQADINRSKGVL